MMDPIVVTEGLTKRFGSELAVDRLDFAISRGAAVGLLGPNGAGKSTIIHMLLGLIEPSSGSASLLGIDPSRDGASVRGRVGYVPEQHHIYPWMTVDQVVRFARSFYPTWNDARCAELMIRYALPPEKKVKHLSHGMGTKLSLVLALAHEPELLVLDEPTTGLDPIVRDEFVTEVAKLLEGGEQTILFSSHILSDVERIADTIAILNEGQLLAFRPRAELLATTRRVEVRLNRVNGKPDAPAGTIHGAISGNRWTLTVADWSDDIVTTLQRSQNVEAVQVSDIALEDIFKDYIRGQRPA